MENMRNNGSLAIRPTGFRKGFTLLIGTALLVVRAMEPISLSKRSQNRYGGAMES